MHQRAAITGGPYVALDGVSELEDVRAEVAALREEVARLRDEAADIRALAAMADRDAAGVWSAINAINRAQNALLETQVEHGRTLNHHRRGRRCPRRRPPRRLRG